MGGWRRVGARKVGVRRVGGPKFRPFFFPCPASKFVLFFPLWGSARGILVVFEAPGRSNVHVLEFSGCRVRAPAARRVDGGSAALPFVRLFNGRPSQYLWEDSTGTTHTVHQGEGGEQGLALFCGSTQSFGGDQQGIVGSEKLLACMDDIFVITRPDRVGDVCTAVRQNLWIHACSRINNGKTKVWNAAGHKPAVCEVLDRVAQADDPDANVWRGSEVATERQGLLLLGAPLGHPDFVAAAPKDVGGTRAVSVTHPELTRYAGSLAPLGPLRQRSGEPFAEGGPSRFGGRICASSRCSVVVMSHILGVPKSRCDDVARNTASLPMAMGGLGLRSAVPTSPSAFWASPMVLKLHPEVAICIVDRLSNQPRTPCLVAAAAAAEQLNALPGFTLPSWYALARSQTTSVGT